MPQFMEITSGPAEPYDGAPEHSGFEHRVLVRSGSRVLVLCIDSGCLTNKTPIFWIQTWNVSAHRASLWSSHLESEAKVLSWLRYRADALEQFFGFSVVEMIDTSKTLTVHMPERVGLEIARSALAEGKELEVARWLTSFPDSKLVKDYLEGHGVHFVWNVALKIPSEEELWGMVKARQARCRVNLMSIPDIERAYYYIIRLVHWAGWCQKKGLLPSWSRTYWASPMGVLARTRIASPARHNSATTEIKWGLGEEFTQKLTVKRGKRPHGSRFVVWGPCYTSAYVPPEAEGEAPPVGPLSPYLLPKPFASDEAHPHEGFKRSGAPHYDQWLFQVEQPPQPQPQPKEETPAHVAL